MEMRVGPFETFQLLLVAINAIPAIVFFSLSQNSANSGMPLSVSYALLGILFGSFVLLFFGNGLILSNVPKKAHASAECEFYRNFADGSCGSEGVWWPKEWPVEAGPWGATFLTLQGKPFFIAEMNARVLEDDEEGAFFLFYWYFASLSRLSLSLSLSRLSKDLRGIINYGLNLALREDRLPL